MEVTWKPFLLSSSPASCPPLFAKTQFTSSSYDIFLTDLRHVWKESMDRKSIFKRALVEETPIDPTEDATQMRLLLDHIRNAVDGHAGTRRQLIKNAEDPHALSLHVTTPLPGSFGDLPWVIHFKPLPSASLQHHLTLPLMSKACDLLQQVDDLISRLSAKDHIISKLLDKLESSGMDIANVFPGATGARGSKHTTPREQAARQVQGLGPFDPKRWWQNHSGSRNAQTPHESLPRVLLQVTASAEYVDDEKDEDYLWLSNLPSTVHDAIDKVEDTFAAINRGGHSRKEQSPVAQDDIFERQATPPRFKKSKPEQTPPITAPSRSLPQAVHNHDLDETTTDEEDLDGPSNQSPKTAQEPAGLSVPPRPKSPETMTSPRLKRLGKLGGRESKPPESKPKDSEKAPKEEATESETEDEDASIVKVPESAAQTSSSATEQSTGAPTRRGKLGVLGGKKAPNSASGSASSTPVPEPVSNSSRIRSRIDGKDTADSRLNDHVQSAEASTGERSEIPGTNMDRATSQAKATSTSAAGVALESEQERANRKREELKRMLEKYQGPKKKRKF